jgi:hypothetical protein
MLFGLSTHTLVCFCQLHTTRRNHGNLAKAIGRFSTTSAPWREIWRTIMKLGAIIIGVLLAADLSLSASAAPAIAITEAPTIQHVAVPLSEHAPVAEVCNEYDPNQLSDWRDQPNNPCRPCVRADESITSAYAISELRPYCQ